MALGERSNEFVVREGSIKSARFVQGRERRKAKRECVEEVVGKRRVPSWGGKMGAPIGKRLIRREGRARGATPLLMAKVRSDNRGPEGAADERACKPGSTAGEGRHRTQPLVPEVGSRRNGLCCGTVDGEGGNELDPLVTQSHGGHARSRCEQLERGGTHHSTKEVALWCVGGTPGDDESDAKQSHRRILVKESKRESRTEARSGKSGSGPRDVGQDGLVPGGETVMASSNHSGPVVHTGQGRMG